MKNLTLENLTKVCGGVYSGPSDKLELPRSSGTFPHFLQFDCPAGS